MPAPSLTHRPAFSLLLAALALVAGCASTPQAAPEARIIVRQDLEIPPDSATVRLQNGRIVARNGVDEFEPHCIFEINTVRDTAQHIAPATFDITRISRSTRTFSGMPVMPFGAASSLFGRDDTPSQLYFITEFHLHSRQHPGVRMLTCQVNATQVAYMRHLSHAEIQRALGELAEIQVKNRLH